MTAIVRHSFQPNLPVPQERSYSEETAHAVDSAVRALVDHALEHAAATLRRNRALLDRTVVALLETETLNEPEIELLKQQLVVEGPGPVTLLHRIEGIRGVIDPPVAGPTAETRAHSTAPVEPK